MLSYSPMYTQLKPVGLFEDSQKFLKTRNIYSPVTVNFSSILMFVSMYKKYRPSDNN